MVLVRGGSQLCDRADASRRVLCLALVLEDCQGGCQQGVTRIHAVRIALLYEQSIAML